MIRNVEFENPMGAGYFRLDLEKLTNHGLIISISNRFIWAKLLHKPAVLVLYTKFFYMYSLVQK